MTRLLACAGVLALLSCATAAAASEGGGLAVPNAVPSGGGAVQGESPAISGTDPGAAPAPSGSGAAPFQASPAQSGDAPPTAPDGEPGDPPDDSDEPVLGDEDVAIVVPLPPEAEPREPTPAAERGPSLPITGFDALLLAVLGASMLTVGYAARRAPARRAATPARPVHRS
ncbi:MAG: hypothetical protein WD993_09880 [Thermoleophilaceae bacterium]